MHVVSTVVNACKSEVMACDGMKRIVVLYKPRIFTLFHQSTGVESSYHMLGDDDCDGNDASYGDDGDTNIIVKYRSDYKLVIINQNKLT